MITLRPYQQEALDKLKQSLKSNKEPILVTASVGAGKSLIIAELLKLMESVGYPVLCLTLNSTLIKQNANTYQLQGGKCGIYCAGLKSKECKPLIVFASPHSVSQDIKNKKEISSKPFKLIVVDEAHNIHPHDNKTMYMRIFNHYAMLAQQEQYSFRIVGLTGTPFRGKSQSIIGENAFFKHEVCNISTSYLIDEGYLVRPIFNDIETAYDFKDIKVRSTGKFDQKQIEAKIDERLTSTIMSEILHIVSSSRNGAFIFCSSAKHCHEALKSLPEGEAHIILGETPFDERERIIELAREGKVKYLLSVNCLMTGVDVPLFDTIAWLRPTESLTIYI